jgi:hypothetical protein
MEEFDIELRWWGSFGWWRFDFCWGKTKYFGQQPAGGKQGPAGLTTASLGRGRGEQRPPHPYTHHKPSHFGRHAHVLARGSSSRAERSSSCSSLAALGALTTRARGEERLVDRWFVGSHIRGSVQSMSHRMKMIIYNSTFLSYYVHF